MQINIGLIIDESMGDAVKITVIATGCQPEPSMPVGDLRSQLAAKMAQPVITVQLPAAPPPPPPAPAPVMQAEPAPPVLEPEPALMADAEPPLDLDDLDTPAYLRQGRLLN